MSVEVTLIPLGLGVGVGLAGEAVEREYDGEGDDVWAHGGMISAEGVMGQERVRLGSG